MNRMWEVKGDDDNQDWGGRRQIWKDRVRSEEGITAGCGDGWR